MSPSHGSKNRTRRYRYYVSQAVLRYQDKEAGSVTRIAAHTIEDLVTKELLALLQDGSLLLDLTGTQAIALPQRSTMIERGQRLVNKWESLTNHEQLEIVTMVLMKVTVGREKVSLVTSRTGLLRLLGEACLTTSVESDDYNIELAVSLQRCGIESKLIVAGKDPGPAHNRTILAIQKALDKALKWNQILMTGKTLSMRALAEKNGVSQRYVGHIIKLAWLSPEIMQAIIRGQIPATLSLYQLKRGFPLDWDEQRAKLGFFLS
jgi:site-specific DNA recombinase